MLDNIIVFYIFFTIVGFLAAMLGTIIGAGGGLPRCRDHSSSVPDFGEPKPE